MSVLGIDIGTTGCKAVAFNLDGAQIARAYREYPLHSPRPGWQELDPETVWNHVRETIRETAAATSGDPIRALAISSQGEACHAVDREGRCLSRSPVTFDARTSDAPKWWRERISDLEIARISGMPVHGMYSLNKILWFKHNEPETFARAWKFLCYEDFVLMRLGLPPTISHSLAARTMALDAQSQVWSEKLLDIAGIDAKLFATPAPSGNVVGEIPDSVAADLGLPSGVLAVTGGHDQPAGALGAGIFESGEALYATGTVDCICPVFGEFVMTEDQARNNLCCYPSCSPGLFCSIAFNFTGGSLLKWYRDTFAGDERAAAAASGRDVYDIICESIPSGPERLIILPHFTVTGTPYFDTASRGAIVGMTLTTSRNEIASAILSGVTFEMKLNLEVLQNSGARITRLRASGGGAKSRLWIQRKADIMGLPIAVLEVPEAPALGVAALAAEGAGLIGAAREFTGAAVRIRETIDPGPSSRLAYQERFAIYKQLYPALREINHRLSELTT